MIEVVHTCGHVQALFSLERLAVHAPKIGKMPEQFIKEQVGYLEQYPCPDCYSEYRRLYPK